MLKRIMPKPYVNPLYKPELAAGLRKQVEREFKDKVTSRSWSWAPWTRKPAADTEGNTEGNMDIDLGAEAGPGQPSAQPSGQPSGPKDNRTAGGAPTNYGDTE